MLISKDYKHEPDTQNSDELKSVPEERKSMLEFIANVDQEISRKWCLCTDHKNSRSLTRTLLILLEISGHGIPWFAACLLSLYKSSPSSQDQFWMNVLFALVLDLTVIVITKSMFRRQRPVYNKKDMFVTVSVDHYSFPSGHASRVAMLACLFCFSYITSTLMCIAMSLWSVVVALSRVLLGRHHLGDVICGVLLGLLQAWLVFSCWIPMENCQFYKNYLASFIY